MTTTGVTFLQRRSLPARILDVLETTDETMTVEHLRAELDVRFGVVSDHNTIRQACRRLVHKALVEESWLDVDDEKGYPTRMYRVP